MKTASIFLYSFFLLLLGINHANAQQKHTITLYVDTEKVTMEDIEKTCNFGQGPDISNENYTIYVKKGDTVIWKAVPTGSSSDEDKVEIISVNYSSGTNFFDKRVLKDTNGVVTATVVNGEPDDYEKYDLYFRVYRDGRWLRTDFPIDPKIRMSRFSMTSE